MKQWKLLLVDDEEEFASTLAERLRLRGVDVRTVFRGEDALPAIREERPDLVLLDVLMPGVGGMELLRRLRIECPSLPVILLTGQGISEEELRIGALHGAVFLMKPLSIDELMKTIGGILDTG
ncbi:MAG TPA: response regulator [Syntrophobacter fumaroxidans]|nr:response regulator [Syntrophobacter fumaroxidans]